jgi:hypothetical protein
MNGPKNDSLGGTAPLAASSEEIAFSSFAKSTLCHARLMKSTNWSACCFTGEEALTVRLTSGLTSTRVFLTVVPGRGKKPMFSDGLACWMFVIASPLDEIIIAA